VTSEDRIRQLCSEALAAQDDAALGNILPHLQAAITEHIHNFRLIAAQEVPRLFNPDRT
jgi:hypothetical protein